MVDGSAHLLTLVHGLLGEGAWRDERSVNLLDGGAPFYDVYECADGRFVAVGALEPAFWQALVAGLGIEVEGSQYDPSAWPAHREAFTAAFRSRDRDEWAAVFDGTDACVAPVLSLTEAPHHPHLAARGTFAAGPSGHPVPRTGPRLSATPARDPGAEPVPGAHTTAYLVAHGFSAAEVEALRASGAVVQA
jgi:alpha-methylacyl-CoA racemase